MKAWQAEHPALDASALDESALEPYLQLADGPPPDLMVRTGGESRMSNFLLWQMAYTELYFTDLLWPEFTPTELDKAIAWFAQRDRRFGGESTLRSPLDGQASA
jgi:undecaprenyl diphosphate synthase